VVATIAIAIAMAIIGAQVHIALERMSIQRKEKR